MHNYSTYGKTISSDLSLSLLNPCNIKQDCDIIIRSSKLDIKQREEINSKKSFFIKNNVGMFEIRNGNEILYKTFPKFSPLLLEKTILYTSLPIALFQRGCIALHASCLVINGKTIAFVGKKGSGKSSIASSFLAQGNLICEDRVILEFHDDIFVANPSNINLFKLCPKIERSKKLFQSRLEIESDFLNRDCYKISSSLHRKLPSKIDMILFLNRGDKKCNELSLLQKFKYLFAHSIKPDLKTESKESHKRYLNSLHDLASSSIKFKEICINENTKLEDTKSMILGLI